MIQIEPHSMKKTIILLFAFFIALTLAATFFRHIVLEDIAYEAKPPEEFTEDDF